MHRCLHKTDIRAVRGLLSKSVMEKMGVNCPNVFRDPALLLPLLYMSDTVEKREFVIVPHYTQSKEYKNYEETVYTFVNDYKAFVNRICSSDLVISSSLHGVIIAEAYGVPAILLRNPMNHSMFKYDDYYQSTGRIAYPIVKSIEEALTIKPSVPKLSVIHEIQEKLIESFPNDLWV